jgi:succinyl-diaminopimelate desuccinylase
MSTIDAIALSQSLIACPSVTPEDAGAQDVLKLELLKLGFDITDLPFDGRGSYPVKNFFARKGTDGPHLCFAGHTDVVPPGDEAAWSVPPFSASIVDGKLIGRGAADMKTNICCFVAALSEYLNNYSQLKGSVSLLITGDEEADSINGTERVLEWMDENGQLPDVALVGEPTNPTALGQEIKIGRRGSLTGKLTVRGKQGHVAYPDRADNPLHRLVQMLDAIKIHKYDMGSAYFPATNLEITTIDVGNKASNVIPASGTATFNLRYSDRWKGPDLEAQIRKILDGVSPDYELTVRIGAESFLTQPGEWTNMAVQAVEKLTGNKPALTTTGGTSDARFMARYCPVVEFGLVNKTIHQVDEQVDTADILTLTAIYKEILMQYFR